jgi:DNA-binding Lrp family transcriptional regulator
VIAGYTVRLGQALTLRRIRATVLLQVEPRAAAQVLQRLKAMPEVEIAFTTTGRVDLILQLAANTTQALDETLDRIGAVPGVADTESLIHLSTKIDRAV